MDGTSYNFLIEVDTSIMLISEQLRIMFTFVGDLFRVRRLFRSTACFTSTLSSVYLVYCHKYVISRIYLISGKVIKKLFGIYPKKANN